ncbi:MAG TPA: hypothetical protein VGX91_07665 [Candidatus Cybelea sp.]|jgi:hypothetical protein|nr:hypothetical protein [Candidatus Cybelea sp.]
MRNNPKIDSIIADVVKDVLAGGVRKTKGARERVYKAQDGTPEPATLKPELLKVDSVEDIVKRVLADSRKARVVLSKKAGMVAVREADLGDAAAAVLSAARGTPQQSLKSRPPTRLEIEKVAGDRNVRGVDEITATMKAQRLIRLGKI